MVDQESRCLLSSPIPQLPRDLKQRLKKLGIESQSCDLASGLFSQKRQARTQVEVIRLNESNRRPLFTLTHDSTQTLNQLLEGDFVAFRTSMMPGVRYEAQYLMPAFLNEVDFTEWVPLSVTEGPSIGFVGQGNGSLQHKMIRLNSDEVIESYGFERVSGEQPLRNPINIGLVLRQRVLNSLSKSKALTTNFVVREINYAVAKGDLSHNRTEYLENMNQNLFSLCVRGGGNYSIRLYEALATGRIPVIIDDTMPLPLSEHIDWSAISVRVPISQIDSVGEIVAAFFESKTPGELIQIQHATRQTWLDFLTRSNFFIHAITLMTEGAKID